MKRLISATAALAGLMLSSTASASIVATLEDYAPKLIEVEGQGSKYTKLNSDLTFLTARVHAFVDYKHYSGSKVRIKNYSVWLRLGEQHGSSIIWHNMKGYAQGETFPIGKRPDKIVETLRFKIPTVAWKDFVIAQCNRNANALRKAGYSDDQIFSTDRNTLIAIDEVFTIETNDGDGPENFDFHGTFKTFSKIQVVCKAHVATTVLNPDALPNPTRKKPKVTRWLGSVSPNNHKGACPANAQLSLSFFGASAGTFSYLVKVFNVDASHGGGLETLGGVHIANVGPFKGKMTPMPDGSFRTSAVQNLQFPLKKTQSQIGGYAASASKPSGKTTYRFEVVFPSQAYEPMQEHGVVPFEYTQDCGPARNPAVAGGPGGLAQTDRPNTAPGSLSTSQMLPDLELVKVKKSFKPFELLVQVLNNSFIPTKATQLRATYKQGGKNKQMVTATVPAFKPAGSAWVSLTFKTPVAEADSIHVQLDPNNTVKEAKETNNTAVYQP